MLWGGVTCSDASAISSASIASIGGANPTGRKPVIDPLAYVSRRITFEKRDPVVYLECAFNGAIYYEMISIRFRCGSTSSSPFHLCLCLLLCWR